MSHGFVSRFYYRVRLFNALYIMCMSAVAFFKNHLLADRFWSCASFCCCNFQFDCFFLSRSCPCCFGSVSILWSREHSSAHRVSEPCKYVCASRCQCVYMHQHQKWFSVKEFGAWNNDNVDIDDDDDGQAKPNHIHAEERWNLLLGNAFLQ